MNPKQLKKKSKFLSLVLRHKPEVIGIEMDAQGWVSVSELLEKMAAHNQIVSPEELAEIVENNDKKRFAFSEDGLRIRANQGHSLKLDLGYETVTPPDVLYHGTASRFITSIQQEGLQKRQRHHVHLSLDPDTAKSVGSRHGKAVVLTIDARAMQEAGFSFFVSSNGVWLTDAVPPAYISFP